jgi:hypothetical protein
MHDVVEDERSKWMTQKYRLTEIQRKLKMLAEIEESSSTSTTPSSKGESSPTYGQPANPSVTTPNSTTPPSTDR